MQLAVVGFVQTSGTRISKSGSTLMSLEEHASMIKSFISLKCTFANISQMYVHARAPP